MEEPCNIGLALGIGGGGGEFMPRRKYDSKQKPPVQFHILFPSRHAKEEREEAIEEEKDRSRLRLRTVCEEEDAANGKGRERKKLRLTREQSTLLEDSFREHSTLNQTQKQELANRLNLKPRQVEVWFQNRRARTKLKQTEVDCEFLKKCCESLSDENLRLKKELQELRSMNTGSPFYLQLPRAATLTVCPSCERMTTSDGKSHSSSFDAN